MGVEAVWLSPQPQNRPVANYTILDGTRTLGDYDGGVVGGLFITPLITFGYQGECWGIQTRYWRMNEQNEQLIPSTDTSLTGETVNSLFKAETFDIEATRMFCWQDTTNQLCFGIRYAQLEQATNLSVVQEVDGAAVQVFGGNALCAMSSAA